jgi:proton-dependent oligopeptide transporter, POT family
MPTGDSSDAWIGARHDPSLLIPGNPMDPEHRRASASELPAVVEGKPTLRPEIIDADNMPTEEDLATLPRVADHINWRIYTIAFVELCERFSYYGTQILFQNFVQRNLLTPTGAALDPNGDSNNNPGALGQGQRTATGLGTFFSFWCYFTPLLGAWIADTYLGRYKTIMGSIAIAMVGHILLTGGAAPAVLKHTDGALAAFIIAIIIFGIGTGKATHCEI